MKFSIIIPNWNGQKLLEKNLPAVLATNTDEIIIVDNGSTDDSIQSIISLKSPKIKIIKNKENLGFARAVNQGVEAAKNEIAVLLNNDVAPEKDFLKPLTKDFQDEKVFAVSLNEPQWSWAKGKWVKGFVEHEPGPKTKNSHLSFWANGGSGAFRKNIWEKLGGFDEIYKPFYWEDVDLSYRAWKRGYKIFWDPHSIVHHQHEGTIGLHFSKDYVDFISKRNQLIFTWKNITSFRLTMDHKIYLWKRLLSQLGYWRPLFGALVKFPQILARRFKEFREKKLSDEKIFSQFGEVKTINFLPVLIFLISLVVVSFYLFFLKLGGTSLAAWDEAWYAEIARNVLKSSNPFLLFWNNHPYFDHPPLGFWLIALSFKFLGISEFSARLPVAIAGLGSLLLVFLITKKLFKDNILAFSSAIVLATMPWFWLRARTANLDVILVLFLLAFFYFAFRAAENKRFLLPMAFSLGLAFLTKTLVATLLIPVAIYVLLPSFKKIVKRDGLLFLGTFFLMTLLWYGINFRVYGFPFLERSIFQIGLRTNSAALFMLPSLPSIHLAETLNLLHMGILLYYKPFLLSFLAGVFFLKERNLRIIYLWIVVFLVMFSFSGKTELWHLIPIYPAVAILIPVVFYKIANWFYLLFLRLFKSFNKDKLYFLSSAKNLIINGVILLIIIFIAQRIVGGLYHDIVKDAPPSQEEIMSRELAKYEGVSYLDDDYWPVAVFYSRREVVNIPFADDVRLRSIPGVFENSPKPFLILTKEWLLKDILKEKYKILFKSSDRVLIQSQFK